MLAQKIIPNWVRIQSQNKSKKGTKSQGCGLGSHSHSSSISLNGKFANLSMVWNLSSSNLCDEIEPWSKSSRFHNYCFHQYG